MPEQAPPPEAEQEAVAARDAAEQAALILLAASVVAGEEESETQADFDLNLIRRMVSRLVRGIWRSMFGSRQVEFPTAVDPERIGEQVARAVEMDVLQHVRQLRKAEDQTVAATSLATSVYGMVAQELAEQVPTPVGVDTKLRKTWLSVGDQRVRDLHRRLHGRTRLNQSDFWRWPVTGQRLRFPGDPEAPIEATARCRCVLLLSWATDEQLKQLIKPLT